MDTRTNKSVDRRSFVRGAGMVLGTAPLAGLLASCATQTRARPRTGRTKAEFNRMAAHLENNPGQYLGIAPDEGRLLHLLIRATQARRVLELGTCFGLGTIWMGLALEETGGRITSLEIMADRAAEARKVVAEAALTCRVSLTQGDAHALAPTLAGPFDFVVLNADKSGNIDYVKKLHPKLLAPNALLLALGALSRQEQIQAYLDFILAHPDFDSVVISATKEDGMILSSRRPQ